MLAILLACYVCAFALDPSLDVSQYAHTSWRAGEALPEKISSITQTPDGYLWLGTEFGLLQFDGVRAITWQPPANQHLPSLAVNSLLVAQDGALWIGTWKGLASWKDNRLTRYPELDGFLIMALVQGRDGTVWAGGFAANGPGKLCGFENGTLHCYGEDGTLGKGPVGLYEDHGGNLWVGVLDGLWRWKPGPAQFYPIGGEQLGIQGLAEGQDGALLIAAMGRVARFGARKLTDAYLYPQAARNFFSRSLLRDRDGSLWIGTAGAGLVHVHRGTTDAFAHSDGLSDDTATALFQDREGSIWVATDGGLDRFRDFTVLTFSTNQGFAAYGGAVLAAKDESVWQGAPDGLHRWDHGKVTMYREPHAKIETRQPATNSNIREVALTGLPKYQFVSLTEGDRGRIWVVTNSGVGYLQNDRFTLMDTVPGGIFSSIAADTNGDLWIANWEHGLLHVSGDSLVQHIPWSGLGRHDFATALAFDPLKRGVWLGFSKGGLAYFSDGQVPASYTPAEGLGEGRVNDLRFDQGGALWAATESGLSRLRNGRIATLTSSNGLPCDIVHWAVEDDDRSMWLYMSCGVVRITRTELNAWVSAPNRKIQTTVFSSSDGASNIGDVPTQDLNVAKSPDGRIWFATYTGLSVIDPHHLPSNKIPPPVHIEKITADEKAVDISNGMHLPTGVRHLDIDYTALSLVVPEKVRFRVKLEGEDKDWRELVNVRHVEYTNLPPKQYKFRVLACNNSGVWNEEGAALDFVIPPMWYQTNWFRALCGVLFLTALWAGYEFRLRHLRHQFEMTLEARVGERTRIARELHDTLLQSFHGLLLRFQTVFQLLPERPTEAKEQLGSAIEQAADAITESRDAVQGLRTSAVESNNLAAAINTLGRELARDAGNREELRVEVEGATRELHPIIRDEIYRIAAEALRNAFQHAGARQIEVEMRYDDRQFRLRVRDDGKGFDPAVLAKGGREGHYGLPGMRERAKIAGGKLTVWSEVDAGTEVELQIPARAAYAMVSRRSWLSEKLAGKG